MTTRDTGDIYQETQLLYPWLPPELVQIYANHYIEYGDADTAWAAMQQDPAYDQYFPGNRREDGTLRLTEAQYASTTEGYDEVFTSVGLNPRLFREQYVALITGDVSPDELYRDRVMPIRERVIEASGPIQQYYSQTYGIEMTPEALLASAIDPDIGTQILDKQITMSEIGGEAWESGYEDVSRELVDRLYRQGIDRDDADALFGAASNFVPILNTLARRHGDPDDTFDLEEFVNADIFSDPDQRRRMRRVVAQEHAMFGSANATARSRVGTLTGLTEW